MANEMLQLFLTSLESVGLLILMAVPGFILAKCKMVNKAEASKFLSVMLLYLLQPLVTVNSFLNTKFSVDIVWNMVAVFLFTGIAELIVLFIGMGVTKAVKKIDVDAKGIISYGGAFGNLSNMAIPFLQLLAPGQYEILLYASVSSVIFNLLGWTIGNYVITGDKKYISIKRAVVNPPTIAFIVALPLFIFNVNFASIEGVDLTGLQNTFDYFAKCVGPLMMTMLGIKLTEMSLKELFLDWRVYVASALKLIVFPLVGILLILVMSTFMPTNLEQIRLNLVVITAMPVAANTMMFATMANKETALAAKEVMISTILSAATIPVWIMLFV